MPYLPNLAAPDRTLHARSIRVLTEELERCRLLGIECLVTHLGSHLGTGEEEGRVRIVKAIATALGRADSSTAILVENTAGTKNSLGTTPDDLARILDALGGAARVGVCIDTAHAFAAGYDWRNANNPFFSEVEAAGIASRIRVLHLNDSKVDLGRRADRHEHIGLGCIGVEGLSRVLRQPLFRDLPVILETPVDERRGDLENFEAARALL
jgi:deoxyribonuclease-4